MIPLLAPIFRGPWAQYGETLIYGAHPPRGGVLLSDVIADRALQNAILRRYARHLACSDLRPVVSIWLLRYFEVLFPPIVTAASLLNHAFPLAPESMWLTLDEDGEPKAFHIEELGRSLTEDETHARYSMLVGEHLPPLIEELARNARVAPVVLWSNAARRLQAIFDVLVEQTKSAAAERDRNILLHHATWPGGTRNPLYGKTLQGLRMRDGCLVTISLHRQCCLYYKIPPFDYCAACPIDPLKRAVRAPGANGGMA